jgi:hypothetical protein
MLPSKSFKHRQPAIALRSHAGFFRRLRDSAWVELELMRGTPNTEFGRPRLLEASQIKEGPISETRYSHFGNAIFSFRFAYGPDASQGAAQIVSDSRGADSYTKVSRFFTVPTSAQKTFQVSG